MYLRSGYWQSDTSLLDERAIARARHRLDVFRLELESVGWSIGLMTHDDIQCAGPEAAGEAARAIMTRHAFATNTTRWAFRLADGSVIVGPVQGSGGVIDFEGGRYRLLRAIDRAREGRDLGIYEPAPGHVRVFPRYTPMGNGEPVDIDLRTAVLL